VAAAKFSAFNAILTGLLIFVCCKHHRGTGQCGKQWLGPLETSMGWKENPKAAQCFESDLKWWSGWQNILGRMGKALVFHQRAIMIDDSQMTQMGQVVKSKSGECQ